MPFECIFCSKPTNFGILNEDLAPEKLIPACEQCCMKISGIAMIFGCDVHGWQTWQMQDAEEAAPLEVEDVMKGVEDILRGGE